jgi:hypothetical protein
VWASQVDDMLALERCLQAIGSQPVFSGGASFHHAHEAAGGGHGAAGAGGGGLGGAARYLSSTLGDSFFLVSNRLVAPVGICVCCVLGGKGGGHMS